MCILVFVSLNYEYFSEKLFLAHMLTRVHMFSGIYKNEQGQCGSVDGWNPGGIGLLFNNWPKPIAVLRNTTDVVNVIEKVVYYCIRMKMFCNIVLSVRVMNAS